MRWLFLKAFLGISAIMVLGIAALLILIVEPDLADYSRQEFQLETSFEYQALKPQLLATPKAQWPELLENYPSYFELTASLVAEHELPAQAVGFDLPYGESGKFFADEEDQFYSFFTSPSSGWLILIEEGDSEWVNPDDLENTLLLLLAGPAIVVLLAMLLGIGYLLHRLSRPLRRLELALASFSSEPQTRLDKATLKALPNVCQAFNQMAERLDETLSEQQLMIAAIPHELRTPVARVRFALDMLRGREGASLLTAIERLDEHVDSLQQITESILSLSRLSQAQDFASLSLVSLVNEACERFAPLENLRLTLPEKAQIQGLEPLLQRLIDNLLDNAKRYSDRRIEIQLEETTSHWRLSVINDGALLEEDDCKQLFRPFYRADASRSRHTGGLGVGLALVKRIAERHGGQACAKLVETGVLAIHITLAK